MTLRSAKPVRLGGEASVSLPKPAWPVVGDEEARWMGEVVRGGKWSWVGEHERAFCEEYRKFIGADYCLCMANGTVTLQCALQAVGVEPGDEVIVPGLTWVATAQAALDVGANVVLVDVEPETLCVAAKAVEAAITPKTKAVIPVHLYGCMCDMDALMDIAQRRGLKVVEDVAHQHGSQWRGKGAGAIGDAGSFSFQQSKPLTCGEGGAVTCNDPDVYEACFALKQVGWRPRDVREAPYDDLVPGNRYGHNYRITEMQAVLLRGGLRRLPDQTRIRDENAQYLAERLNRIGGPLRVAKRDPRVTRQAYYCLTMHLDPNRTAGLTPAQYRDALTAEGCAVGKPYYPVYRNPLMNLYDRASPVPFRDPAQTQDYANLKLPNVERAVENTLLLGHAALVGSRGYMDQLVEAVAKVNDHLPALKQLYDRQEDAT